MATETLANLRTRIRQRTDNEHVGNAFVTNAELTQLINAAYRELYGLLAENGIHQTETTQTITADGSTAYALTTGAYAILAVFRDDSGREIRLPRHDIRVRPGTADTGIAGSYRVIGTNIEFWPTPGSGTYKVVYVPEPTALSADGDTVQGVLGWEEYIVVHAAINVLQKEESDTGPLERKLGALMSRIANEAANREHVEKHYIAGSPGPCPVYFPGDYVGWRGYR